MALQGCVLRSKCALQFPCGASISSSVPDEACGWPGRRERCALESRAGLPRRAANVATRRASATGLSVRAVCLVDTASIPALSHLKGLVCLRARSPAPAATTAHCCHVQLPARQPSMPAECHRYVQGSELRWDVWRAWTLPATAHPYAPNSACTTHPDTTAWPHRTVRPKRAAERVLSWWCPVPAVWEASLSLPSLVSSVSAVWQRVYRRGGQRARMQWYCAGNVHAPTSRTSSAVS